VATLGILAFSVAFSVLAANRPSLTCSQALLGAVHADAIEFFWPVEQVPLPTGPVVCMGLCVTHAVDRIGSHFASAPLLLSADPLSVRSNRKAPFDQTTKRLRERRPVGLVLRPLDDGRSQRWRRPKAHQRCKSWTLFRLADHLQRRVTLIEDMYTAISLSEADATRITGDFDVSSSGTGPALFAAGAHGSQSSIGAVKSW
jgi:hypothetical protein